MTQLLRTLGDGRRAVNLTEVTYAYTGVAADWYGCDIKPSNDYVAISGTATTQNLTVYSWDGKASLTEVAQVDYGAPDFYTCEWHPTSSHIAVNITDTSKSVSVYSFTGGNTLTNVAYQAMGGSGASMVAWHPSGNYLAASAYTTSNNIKVYSWNGTDTLTEVESISTGANAYTVSWAPSGDYLLSTGPLSTKEIQVYSWNGTDTLTEVASYNNSTVTPYECSWTSDDAYVFVGCPSTTASLKVFAFSGSALTLKQTINAGLNGYSSDIYMDKYLAEVYYRTGSGTETFLRYYSFNRTTETLTEVDTWSVTAVGLGSVSFNKWGTYLAVGAYSIANRSVFIIRI